MKFLSYVIFRFVSLPFFKALMVLIFLIKAVTYSNAQQNQDSMASGEGSFTDNLFTGGNFGFTFGQSVAFIEIAPIVGKKITDNIALGIGPTYRYIYFRDIYHNYTLYDMKINNYGFSVFGRYYFDSDYISVINNLFTHAEVEYNYMYYKFMAKDINVNDERGGIDFTNVYVGGGYKQPIGDFSSFNLLILWNLNETPFSPYPNPLLRLGFTVGL